MVGWHCGAATQRAGVHRQALCVHRAAGAPSSKCIFHLHYVSPSMPTQNGRDGLAGWGENLPYPILRSQSSTSVNDARPWKLYTPPGMCAVCGDVMYVCHSIRRQDGDPLTFKPTLHLIRFVVDLLYNKLWTCRGCCGYVVDLLLVCCTT